MHRYKKSMICKATVRAMMLGQAFTSNDMQGDQACTYGQSYLAVVPSTCARAIGWPDSSGW
jgi:hypothetical protein